MSTIAPTVRQLPATPPGRLRPGVLAVVIAVALGLLASIFAGTASAATVKRHVDPQPGSSLYIHDDESWPYADESRTFDMSHQYLGVLSPTLPTDEYGVSHCAGDEVRVNQSAPDPAVANLAGLGSRDAERTAVRGRKLLLERPRRPGQHRPSGSPPARRSTRT